MKKHGYMTREEFLRIVAISLGGMAVACHRRTTSSPIEPLKTATPYPMDTQAPINLTEGATADLVITNGRIYTVDANNTILESLAVANGHILKTGKNDEISALAAPDTQMIDLSGRSVTPGLIDPHLHFRGYGLMDTYYTPFNPPDVVDIRSMQLRLQEVIKGKPSGEWINGTYMALRDKPIPTKEDLDPYSKDNPVFMMHIGGHWGTGTREIC
jgi:predicted amidohydrolase YtcJ